MMALSPTILPRAGQLVRMMASDHDGEALGAVRALGRVLTSAGVSFHDLAEAIEASGEVREHLVHGDKPRASSRPPTWAYLTVQQRIELLDHLRDEDWWTEWEGNFLTAMWAELLADKTMTPSPKQRECLDRLFLKAFVKGVRLP